MAEKIRWRFGVGHGIAGRARLWVSGVWPGPLISNLDWTLGHRLPSVHHDQFSYAYPLGAALYTHLCNHDTGSVDPIACFRH